VTSTSPPATPLSVADQVPLAATPDAQLFQGLERSMDKIMDRLTNLEMNQQSKDKTTSSDPVPTSKEPAVREMHSEDFLMAILEGQRQASGLAFQEQLRLDGLGELGEVSDTAFKLAELEKLFVYELRPFSRIMSDLAEVQNVPNSEAVRQFNTHANLAGLDDLHKMTIRAIGISFLGVEDFLRNADTSSASSVIEAFTNSLTHILGPLHMTYCAIADAPFRQALTELALKDSERTKEFSRPLYDKVLESRKRMGITASPLVIKKPTTTVGAGTVVSKPAARALRTMSDTNAITGNRGIQSLRCFNCNQMGHTKKLCPSAPRCHVCKMVGHTAPACPNRTTGGPQPTSRGNFLPKASSGGGSATLSPSGSN